MPRITVSFKHNKEDLELYNDIMKHSDKSGYIKDILKGNRPIKNLIDTNADKEDNVEFKDFRFE